MTFLDQTNSTIYLCDFTISLLFNMMQNAGYIKSILIKINLGYSPNTLSLAFPYFFIEFFIDFYMLSV